ncbi:cytochrome c oxidase subunit 7A, mitochondrial [Bacillus rossius redtenbacheri]|uniref:cytochrome c oxidase subunit 7A, mitochondrial n=1 Tax=Bacillus rossius redtenbacheri TaxID=93214 RepID=UPI002FDD0C41
MSGVVLKRAAQVAGVCARRLNTSSPRLGKASEEVVIADYSKLKKKQEHFQLDSDVPVYLKGGLFDRLLYHATLGLGAVGLALGARFFYQAAYPKK